MAPPAKSSGVSSPRTPAEEDETAEEQASARAAHRGRTPVPCANLVAQKRSQKEPAPGVEVKRLRPSPSPTSRLVGGASGTEQGSCASASVQSSASASKPSTAMMPESVKPYVPFSEISSAFSTSMKDFQASPAAGARQTSSTAMVVRSRSSRNRAMCGKGTKGDEIDLAVVMAASVAARSIQVHQLKHFSVGAALARSALARLQNVSWADVAVDCCPKEKLAEANRRMCALLGLDTLGIVDAGGRGGGSNSREIRMRGGRGGGGGSGGSGGGVGGGGGGGGRKNGGEEAPSEQTPTEATACLGGEEELRMSALFPLPPPERSPRFVKTGVYAPEPGAASALSPALLRPNDSIPDGKIVGPTARAAIVDGDSGKSALPVYRQSTAYVARARAAYEASKWARGPLSLDSFDLDKFNALMVSQYRKPSAAQGDGMENKSAEGVTTSAPVAPVAVVAAADTDSDSASTSTNADLATLSQQNMTLAARSRAYKGIFRTGGEKPKKRPRSPVVSTLVKVPFPMAPEGGVASLATNQLVLRPPCGSDEMVQTEFGSNWAWGMLGDDSGGGSGGGGGGGSDGGGGGSLLPLWRDFRLPYDVLYSHYMNDFLSDMRQLGMRSVEDALAEFQGLTSNVYISRKPSTKDPGEAHRCGCVPPPHGQAGCMEGCSNRATREECSPRTCGLEGKCTCANRRIQKHKQEHLRKKVGIKDVGAKGIGVVAKTNISAGALIGEYVGEVMSESDWQLRQAELGESDRHKYVMDLGEGEVIDASQKGSILRFVNHSCGPNAETQKWTVQGKRRIGLFSKTEILKGEEVTFNYCYVRYDEEARDCLCGHPDCIKTLGTKRGEDGDSAGGVLSVGAGRGGGGASGGRGSSGSRRCRQKVTPRWQDPETGEHMRPWLHRDDANAMDRLITHMLNTSGRVYPGHVAVVTEKKLFLKRNIPVVCRGIVHMHAVRKWNEVFSAAGVASGAHEVATAESRKARRLRILEARVETQLERCLTDERQSTRPDHDAGGGGDGCGGGGDDLDGGDDAVMSEAMPSCIGVSSGKNGSSSDGDVDGDIGGDEVMPGPTLPSFAGVSSGIGGGSGGGGGGVYVDGDDDGDQVMAEPTPPSWPPSVQRLRLAVRRMQVEALRSDWVQKSREKRRAWIADTAASSPAAGAPVAGAAGAAPSRRKATSAKIRAAAAAAAVAQAGLVAGIGSDTVVKRGRGRPRKTDPKAVNADAGAVKTGETVVKACSRVPDVVENMGASGGGGASAGSSTPSAVMPSDPLTEGKATAVPPDQGSKAAGSSPAKEGPAVTAMVVVGGSASSTDSGVKATGRSTPSTGSSPGAKCVTDGSTATSREGVVTPPSDGDGGNPSIGSRSNSTSKGVTSSPSSSPSSASSSSHVKCDKTERVGPLSEKQNGTEGNRIAGAGVGAADGVNKRGNTGGSRPSLVDAALPRSPEPIAASSFSPSMGSDKEDVLKRRDDKEGASSIKPGESARGHEGRRVDRRDARAGAARTAGAADKLDSRSSDGLSGKSNRSRDSSPDSRRNGKNRDSSSSPRATGSKGEEARRRCDTKNRDDSRIRGSPRHDSVGDGNPSRVSRRPREESETESNRCGQAPSMPSRRRSSRSRSPTAVVRRRSRSRSAHSRSQVGRIQSPASRQGRVSRDRKKGDGSRGLSRGDSRGGRSRGTVGVDSGRSNGKSVRTNDGRSDDRGAGRKSDRSRSREVSPPSGSSRRDGDFLRSSGSGDRDRSVRGGSRRGDSGDFRLRLASDSKSGGSGGGGWGSRGDASRESGRRLASDSNSGDGGGGMGGARYCSRDSRRRLASDTKSGKIGGSGGSDGARREDSRDPQRRLASDAKGDGSGSRGGGRRGDSRDPRRRLLSNATSSGSGGGGEGGAGKSVGARQQRRGSDEYDDANRGEGRRRAQRSQDGRGGASSRSPVKKAGDRRHESRRKEEEDDRQGNRDSGSIPRKKRCADGPGRRERDIQQVLGVRRDDRYAGDRGSRDTRDRSASREYRSQQGRGSSDRRRSRERESRNRRSPEQISGAGRPRGHGSPDADAGSGHSRGHSSRAPLGKRYSSPSKRPTRPAASATVPAVAVAPSEAGSRARNPDGGAGVKISGDSRSSGAKAGDAGGGREQGRMMGVGGTPPVNVMAGRDAVATTVGGDGATGDGSDSPWSDVSDTEIGALRSLKEIHGEDWRRVLGVEAEERLGLEMDDIRVRVGQEAGELPPTEDQAKKPREIVSMLIPKASRKLPRDVYRQVLESFQIMILEPYYYPAVSTEPPAYVIGPICHVGQALSALIMMHTGKLDATVPNVMEMALSSAHLIHRSQQVPNVLTRPQSYDIEPQHAEALMDKKRLGWLSAEICRLTGTKSVKASPKQWLRRKGSPVCKVTIEGTARQCHEAWTIVEQVLERYPVVVAFMRNHPPSPPAANGVSAVAASTSCPIPALGRGLPPPTAPGASYTNSAHLSGATAGTGVSSPTAGKGKDGQSAPPAVRRKGLQFGQGMGTGFKKLDPLPKDKASKPEAPKEWEDGWCVPEEAVKGGGVPSSAGARPAGTDRSQPATSAAAAAASGNVSDAKRKRIQAAAADEVLRAAKVKNGGGDARRSDAVIACATRKDNGSASTVAGGGKKTHPAETTSSRSGEKRVSSLDGSGTVRKGTGVSSKSTASMAGTKRLEKVGATTVCKAALAVTRKLSEAATGADSPKAVVTEGDRGSRVSNKAASSKESPGSSEGGRVSGAGKKLTSAAAGVNGTGNAGKSIVRKNRDGAVGVKDDEAAKIKVKKKRSAGDAPAKVGADVKDEEGTQMKARKKKKKVAAAAKGATSAAAAPTSTSGDGVANVMREDDDIDAMAEAVVAAITARIIPSYITGGVVAAVTCGAYRPAASKPLEELGGNTDAARQPAADGKKVPSAASAAATVCAPSNLAAVAAAKVAARLAADTNTVTSSSQESTPTHQASLADTEPPRRKDNKAGGSVIYDSGGSSGSGGPGERRDCRGRDTSDTSYYDRERRSPLSARGALRRRDSRRRDCSKDSRATTRNRSETRRHRDRDRRSIDRASRERSRSRDRARPPARSRSPLSRRRSLTKSPPPQHRSRSRSRSRERLNFDRSRSRDDPRRRRAYHSRSRDRVDQQHRREEDSGRGVRDGSRQHDRGDRPHGRRCGEGRRLARGKCSGGREGGGGERRRDGKVSVDRRRRGEGRSRSRSVSSHKRY